MKSFKIFLESKTDNTYTLKAVTDLAHALKVVFDKYAIDTRKKAWTKITSDKGDKEVKKLIRNPERNITSFRTL